MAAIPLIVEGPAKTVVDTEPAFHEAGGREGEVIFIRPLDRTQLYDPESQDSNTTYDLRVGPRYRHPREEKETPLFHDMAIRISPGASVIIETEEYVELPRKMFGLIIPKVTLLQRGLSNTSSKVDPGYPGHLQVTVFNLGNTTEELKRLDKFCALCIFQVSGGAKLYEKGEQRTLSQPKDKFLKRLANSYQRYGGSPVSTLAFITSIISLIAALLRIF
jgi:dCTP deaminase